MKVLVACELSGTVTDAFINKGHDAWSCDIEPCEGQNPNKHLQGNVMDFITKEKWDLMIAFPPCTYLSYIGLRHWNNPGRKEKREAAMEFFMKLYNCSIPKIALENPLGYPNKMFRKPDQIIHPYYFGDPFKKRTCLWLKELPKLVYMHESDMLNKRTSVPKPEPLYYLATTGKAINYIEGIKGMSKKERQKARSKFWPGIADAMAEQWGNL